MWRACLDAVGSLPGNPLGVVVEPASDIPLGMVGAIDSAEINRVIGLGIVRDEVELMVGFCRLHAGSHFGIELSPDAQPVDVRRWLTEADLHPSPGGVSKMGSDITEIPPPHGDLNVCRLDEEHRAAVGELSVLEWGGWSDGACYAIGSKPPLGLWTSTITGSSTGTGWSPWVHSSFMANLRGWVSPPPIPAIGDMIYGAPSPLRASTSPGASGVDMYTRKSRHALPPPPSDSFGVSTIGSATRLLRRVETPVDGCLTASAAQKGGRCGTRLPPLLDKPPCGTTQVEAEPNGGLLHS